MGIPKRVKKTTGKRDYRRTFTYELIKEYANHGLYRCLETGFKECFTKNELTRRPIPKPIDVRGVSDGRFFCKN